MTHTHQPPASMESLKQPFEPSENATLGSTCRNCERLRAALNDIAQHQDSEWPLRCRMNVRTARAALKEPT